MPMQLIQVKKRWILIRWLRRLIYKLNSEQAAIEGAAALWVPHVACVRCKWAIMSGSLFCSYCGARQGAEESGPETESRYTVLVGGQSQPMRLNGQRPRKAYQQLLATNGKSGPL